MTIIRNKKVLGALWPTQNPFLFLAHHVDSYPRGTDQLGPIELLPKTKLGEDFEPTRPWRMYHGHRVPGFPMHPHRGFETVTLVMEGVVDHFDSNGGAGRYSDGDVQWMTAGAGLQHCEMFPLLKDDSENSSELFQIWLNLPQKDKLTVPAYKMLWAEQIPSVQVGLSKVRVIAGSLGAHKALKPADDSWANDEKNHVRIMTIELREGEVLFLKPESTSALRSLYHYCGEELCLCTTSEVEINESFSRGEGLYAGFNDRSKRIEKAKSAHICTLLPSKQMASLENTDLLLWAERGTAKLLYLAGEPIDEPVAQYGPFVMNSRAEIQQAFWDYEKTQFGGWPWKSPEPVHPRDFPRQARNGDGIVSMP